MGSYLFSFTWYHSGIIVIFAVRGDLLFRLGRGFRIWLHMSLYGVMLIRVGDNELIVCVDSVC